MVGVSSDTRAPEEKPHEFLWLSSSSSSKRSPGRQEVRRCDATRARTRMGKLAFPRWPATRNYRTCRFRPVLASPLRSDEVSRGVPTEKRTPTDFASVFTRIFFFSLLVLREVAKLGKKFYWFDNTRDIQ